MHRTGGWAGIIGGVMLVVGFFMSTIQTGSEDGSQKVLDFYAKSGNTNRLTIGAMLVFAACAILLYFFLALGQHVGSTTAARYVAIGGAIFVAVAAVGVAGVASAAAVATFGDAEIKSVDVIYYGQSLGYGTLIAAGAFGGLTMVAAGVAGRGGAFRSWLCWVSIIAGVVVALGSVIFLPMMLLFIWIIAVGIVLVRSGDTVTS